MKIVTQLALVALLWIGVINTGSLGSSDTDFRLQMAHAWWTGTPEVSPDFKPIIRGEIGGGLMGTGGKRYINYDLGQSMLMLPADWIGTQLHRFIPNRSAIPELYLRRLIVSFLIFVPLNVAMVIACFYLLRLFEFKEKLAGLTSIVMLMGTTVLNYAQIHQQNNQILLLTLTSYALSLVYLQRGKYQFAIGSGLSIGIAVLIRNTSIINALTSLMFLLGCIAYQSRNRYEIWQCVWQCIWLWTTGFLPIALFDRTLAFFRYGNFWATGSSVFMQTQATDPFFAQLPALPPNYPLINSPEVGILGVLFAPAKSIFIYDPLLIPCLAIAFLTWKMMLPYMRWYLIVNIFNLAMFLILTSKVEFWSGDVAWGARYHVTSVHLIIVPLLALLIQRWQHQKIKNWFIAVLIAISITIQIISVVMPNNLEVVQTLIRGEKTTNTFTLGRRTTNILCLFNNSFSDECTDKILQNSILSEAQKNQLQYDNRMVFLPFNMGNKIGSKIVTMLVLSIWILVLLTAIFAITNFCWQLSRA
ncbi:hypothetical protein [Pseudanabaena sp. 'Roaring Creek']|uniref:hypothetical protein n=1 Tax=Pseudanabaena sp. 'Roaring Creek' TaxID=1681830 RepID=UPI0006D7A84C|nr:hypothetical protein [Pseudanabaena sp. 'Roaring Creek']